MEEYLGIKINSERDNLFDELGVKRLKESYMTETETSPQQRFAFVAKAFGSDLEHAQRLYEYASKHWLSFATPILSYGKSKNGLPISCFLSPLIDSASGLVDTLSEVNTLSMLGGGVGIGVHIRSADEKSVGVMPHLKIYDASCLAYRQGKTRRGSYAAYLRIDHPDVMMFLEMRKPTGDQNVKCLNLHHGIILTDKFMNIIEQCMLDSDFDDSWNLYDTHNPDKIKETVSAKELWQKIIELRMQTGEPYILFIDTANEQMPEFQKNIGLDIKQSNICTEILLNTNHERTAVCCLSSVNLRYYDDFKDNYQFFKDVAEMLDNVLTTFIKDAPDAISRAKYSAERERAIGVGTLGFHTYLQQNNVPFESALAKSRNMQIFKNIRTHLDKANEELGEERGSCPDFDEGMQIYDIEQAKSENKFKRFSHVMAIAPTACQDKSNKIQVLVDGEIKSISLSEVLEMGGVDVDSIENTFQKQWVSFSNPVEVPTLSGTKTVSQAWYNGLEELFEIEFEDGKVYKFTENHRLMVANSYGESEWVRVGDLTGDEEIVSV